MSRTPDFDVDLMASIDVPSTRQLSLGERTDSIKVMHDDLMTLAENDGCIAAAWALDAIRGMAAKIRSLRSIEAAAQRVRIERNAFLASMARSGCQRSASLEAAEHDLDALLDAKGTR